MTISELKTLRYVLNKKPNEDSSLELIKYCIGLIDRELNLREINPVTGRMFDEKCPECGFLKGHTNYCSQGRD